MKIERNFQPITITIDDSVQWEVLKFSLWYVGAHDTSLPYERHKPAQSMYEEIERFEKCQ